MLQKRLAVAGLLRWRCKSCDNQIESLYNCNIACGVANNGKNIDINATGRYTDIVRQRKQPIKKGGIGNEE